MSTTQWDRKRAPSSPPRAFNARPRHDAPGTFDVHVPFDLDYFRGHFPGQAILAGIVQVDVLVLRQVAETWPTLTRLARITRLRFRRPIRPGDDLVLTLVRAAPTRVEFQISCREASCAAGTLHFRDPAPE
jgi:3-hydroxymyristoyl/3-hydroxydecanoyl-(acyl carrier protein) dehydratase